MLDKYNIVLAPDNNYVEHACATIASIIHNSEHLDKLVFNIIDQELTTENKKYISKLLGKYNVEVTFKPINKRILANVVVNGHISEATYYRILSPSILEKDIKKFLYLDCDIIVRDDITKLFSYDIGDKIIGAIRNYEFKEHLRNIDLPIDTPYFNAGVLLINKKMWEQFNITNKVINYINDNPGKLILWDQDALNAVLFKDWYELPLKWNVRTTMFNFTYELAGAKNEGEFKELLQNPAIVHFTTNIKPWNYFSKHSYKSEYEKYQRLSGCPSKKIEEIKKIIAKEIYIFGASKKGEHAYKTLNASNLSIRGFLDNDANKWTKQLMNKIIFSPKEILNNLNGEIIVIASQYENEIIEQLKKNGLIENHHFYILANFLSI